MMVRLGGLVAVVALVAGCSWTGADDGRDRNPANQPGYLRPRGCPQEPGSPTADPLPPDAGSPTADPLPPDDGSQQPGQQRPGPQQPGPQRAGCLRPGDDATNAHGGHVVTGSGTDVRDVATFQLVNGADVVRVRVRDLGDRLFRMSTPDDAKVAPAVQVDRSSVVAGLRGTGQPGPAIVTVELSDDVAWNVRLAGGATEAVVDLTGGRGGNVDFSAGVARAEVALPGAAGTQRVTMSGGASQFTVRLGGAGPVRVAATGGAGSVTVDGATHAGVAGGTVWTPDGWDAASSRYDIDATAGVSTMIVERS